MESPMMPAPMTTTSALSRMVRRRHGRDGGTVQLPVGRHEAAGVDELVAAVIERVALGVRAAPPRCVDEGLGGACVPTHPRAPELQISVVGSAGDESALEAGAPVRNDLARPQRLDERGEL